MAGQLHKGAKLDLRCPGCGQTVGTVAQINAAKPRSLIYTDGQTTSGWPPFGAELVRLTCPRGCEGTIGGPAAAVREAVNALADDPARFFGEFTLQRV